MSDLTAFLLARLRDGDATIRKVGQKPPWLGPLWFWRVAPRWMKQTAAAVYSDHPDYNEAWRP